MGALVLIDRVRVSRFRIFISSESLSSDISLFSYQILNLFHQNEEFDHTVVSFYDYKYINYNITIGVNIYYWWKHVKRVNNV